MTVAADQERFPGRTGHKKIPIETPEGDRVEIDEGIVPLIEALWAHEIATRQSCQGPWDDAGRAFVEFWSPYDGERLLDALGLDPDDDERDGLFMRVGAGWLTDTFTDERQEWRWEAQPEFHIEDDGTPSFYFTLSVYFPRSDIPELVRRLTAQNPS